MPKKDNVMPALPNLLQNQRFVKRSHDTDSHGKAQQKGKIQEETKQKEEYTSHRMTDYRKIYAFYSEEAKAKEIARRYPNRVERELICSCAGEWEPAKTKGTPVLADVVEINEFGVVLDISHNRGWYLGDLKIRDLKVSLIDTEGAVHTATMSNFLEDCDGNTPHTLEWNNGEVWTKRSKYYGEEWTKRKPERKRPEISCTIEEDPEHPGMKLLRWSDGEVEVLGSDGEALDIDIEVLGPDGEELVEPQLLNAMKRKEKEDAEKVWMEDLVVTSGHKKKKQDGEVSYSDESLFQTYAESLVPPKIHPRIQELLTFSSQFKTVKVVQATDGPLHWGMEVLDGPSAAIEEDHCFDDHGNLQGIVEL